jgi:outer membrane lipopolysaccharide assembly protein LptE/RlpB
MKTGYAKRIAALLLTMPFLLSGCGYTTKSLLPSEFKTVQVENFVNKINVAADMTDARMYTGYRPGMETEVTRAVIDRFLFDGNLTIAKGPDADIMLKGELTDYRREALRYDANAAVQEYRVRIVVDLELINARTGKTVWKEKNFEGETTYDTGGALAKTESAAISDAIKDLARRIVERTVEAW